MAPITSGTSGTFAESASTAPPDSSKISFLDEMGTWEVPLDVVGSSHEMRLDVPAESSRSSFRPHSPSRRPNSPLRNLADSTLLPPVEEIPKIPPPDNIAKEEVAVEALRQGVRAGMPRRKRNPPETPRIDGPRNQTHPANLHRYFAHAMRKRVEVEVHRLFRHAGVVGVQEPLDGWQNALNNTLDLFQEYANWIDRRHAELSGTMPQKENEESERCEALLQQLSQQEYQLQGITRQHEELQTNMKGRNRSYWRELCYLRSMLPEDIQKVEDVHFYEGGDDTLNELQRLRRRVEDLEALVERLKKLLAKAEEDIDTQKQAYETEAQEMTTKWRTRLERMQEEHETRERELRALTEEYAVGGMFRADFEHQMLRHEEKQQALMSRMVAELREAELSRQEAEAQKEVERARADKAAGALQQYKDLTAKRTGTLAALQQKLQAILARAEAAAPPEGLERALEIARNELQDARHVAEVESARSTELEKDVEDLRRRLMAAEATAEDLRAQLATLEDKLRKAQDDLRKAQQELQDALEVAEQSKKLQVIEKPATQAPAPAPQLEKPVMVDASVMTDAVEVPLDKRQTVAPRKTKTAALIEKDDLTSEKFQRNVRDVSLSGSMTGVQVKKAESVINALKNSKKTGVVVKEGDTSSWNIARKNIASGKLGMLESLKRAAATSDVVDAPDAEDSSSRQNSKELSREISSPRQIDRQKEEKADDEVLLDSVSSALSSKRTGMRVTISTAQAAPAVPAVRVTRTSPVSANEEPTMQPRTSMLTMMKNFTSSSDSVGTHLHKTLSRISESSEEKKQEAVAPMLESREASRTTLMMPTPEFREGSRATLMLRSPRTGEKEIGSRKKETASRSTVQRSSSLKDLVATPKATPHASTASAAAMKMQSLRTVVEESGPPGEKARQSQRPTSAMADRLGLSRSTTASVGFDV